MNERIKELAIKAGLLSADYNGFDSNRLTKSEEKFAELIVRECCDLLETSQEPVAWRNAALRVGEDLCSVGPFGYYDMTAEQWLDWALSVVTVHAPPASKPWVGLDASDYCGQSEEWCDGALAAEAKLKEKNIK